MVPLINQILTCKDYAPKSNAPLAIILCPEWESAQDVSEKCTDLGSQITVANDGKPFRVGCVFANEMKHAAELYNGKKVTRVFLTLLPLLTRISIYLGCHVLVTTPTSLKRMLDPSFNITSMDRCCHLIIECADDCIVKFHQEIDFISKAFLKERRKYPNQPNQVSLIKSNSD